MADMLVLWGESRAARITRIDFGAVPAKSSGDVRFRIKNQSSQYTAQDAVVSVEGVSAWTTATNFLLSLDGLNFAETVLAGDLPPAAISPVITLRRTTAGDAPLVANGGVIRVHAAAWVPADTLQ